MSFDWGQYLTLAQELVGQDVRSAGQEARQRAAISRAYYAVFCQARNYLRDQQGRQTPVGGQVHAYVRQQFRDSPNPEHNHIGHHLNRLRIDRNKVDYEDTIAGLQLMAQADLLPAAQVLSLLGRV
ncbi:MAG: hypothetical protein ACREOH_22690 [Candidatus Entotheonellia bacterium]